MMNYKEKLAAAFGVCSIALILGYAYFSDKKDNEKLIKYDNKEFLVIMHNNFGSRINYELRHPPASLDMPNPNLDSLEVYVSDYCNLGDIPDLNSYKKFRKGGLKLDVDKKHPQYSRRNEVLKNVIYRLDN